MIRILVIVLNLVLILSSCDSPRVAAPIGLEAIKKKLERRWPDNQTITIVFHGHSVPAGYFATPTVRTFDSYPTLVHQRLCEMYPTAVINCIVTAIGGENCEEGLVRFERDVLSLNPDLVLIDYGLNDRALDTGTVKKAWAKMVTLAKHGGVPVILVTPTGARDVDFDENSDPLRLRTEIIRATSRQQNVLLADVYKAWADTLRSGLPQDSLLSHINHPNRRGHELVTQVIMNLF